MATNTVNNLRYQPLSWLAAQPGADYLFTGLKALKGQFAYRFSFLAICSVATAMLLSQQAVAADLTAAPIPGSDNTSFDNNNAPSQHGGREWMITPNLGFEETYSDNVGLAPRGSEKSDWITQINPGLSLIGTGPNLKVNANYQIQKLLYSDNSIGQTTKQQLNADAKAKLVDDLFFVDGRAAIIQQNISALGTLAIDNTNVTNNRTDVRTYSIAPYLQHHFHDIASGELRYTHGEVDTDTAGLASSQTDDVSLNLNSGTAFKTLGWGVNYDKNQIDYSSDTPSISTAESEHYSGTLRYLITPRFSLNATGGYEKYDYLSIGQQPEGSSLTAGFSWAPSTRTNVEAAAGHRFFGKTYSLNASHHTRRTAWNLSYNEDITTTQSQFLIPSTLDTSAFLNNLWASSIPDPAVRQQTVDAFIHDNQVPTSLSNPINYLSNAIFLQKRLQTSVALSGARNTLVLSMFGMTREAQTSTAVDSALLGAGAFASQNKTKQIGGSALWNWQVSPRTSANINTTASATSRKEYIKSLRAGLSRQLQPKLSGSIDLRRVLQVSDQSGIGYQENAITASLLMKF